MANFGLSFDDAIIVAGVDVVHVIGTGAVEGVAVLIGVDATATAAAVVGVGVVVEGDVEAIGGD